MVVSFIEIRKLTIYLPWSLETVKLRMSLSELVLYLRICYIYEILFKPSDV